MLRSTRNRMAPIARFQMFSTAFRTAAERSSCSPTATSGSARLPAADRRCLTCPGVGLVTCLYRGLPVAGVWSRLAAAEIDHRFLPSVLVGLRLGLAKPCFGSTIALRARDAAANWRICRFRRSTGRRLCDRSGRAAAWAEVAIPPMVVDHVCSEHSFAELARHELRWARTIRLVDPARLRRGRGYASAAVRPRRGGPAGLRRRPLLQSSGSCLLAASWSRYNLRVVWRRESAGLARSGARFAEFAIFVASFLPWRVIWRGRRYQGRAGWDAYASLKETRTLMRTLFLQAPSFDGFDGGAGSRYQARREIRSFWYPTWLAQPAALVAGQQAHRRPAARRSPRRRRAQARDYDLVVLHTSTPVVRRRRDGRRGDEGRESRPQGGPDRRQGRRRGRQEPEARRRDRFRRPQRVRLHDQGGRRGPRLDDDRRAQLPQRGRRDRPQRRRGRCSRTWTRCRSSRRVYKRDLEIENYFIGYLKHPYISLYTGRGCKSRCTFCLWPQTVGGHRYRTRSVGHVIEEIRWAQKALSRR